MVSSGDAPTTSGDYFLTGGTGFIGRHLIQELLRRRTGKIFVLVRTRSLGRFEEQLARRDAGAERVVPVVGDLVVPSFGLAGAQLADLCGRVAHFFHVGGLYDMAASERALDEVNVVGTRNAVEVAERIAARRFHHVSSIAVAGRYDGVFREDMFDEAGDLQDPYFRTKHESERIVRTACAVPWRIYRPSLVVGHSVTGEMDKVDGPYYFFPLLSRLGASLPAFLPLPRVGTGYLNLVPVDFVAAALDHLAHREGLDRRTFHLVDPSPRTAAETINVFADAARAPRLSLPIPGLNGIAETAMHAIAHYGDGVASRLVQRAIGIPPRALHYVGNPTIFDCGETLAALAGSGIAVPPLASYAPRLWSYWDGNLHPDSSHTQSLERAVRGKYVLVTGASSGIGRALAIKVAAAGAHAILVARRADQLAEVRTLIERAGGTASAFPTDLTDAASVERLCHDVVARFGGVDVLVNNAGRSIRRSLSLSEDRFHDFERTMEINYFGAVRLLLGLLPAMRKRGGGHVVNVSSIGAQVGTPRFSAYIASKAALDGFSRCAAPELIGDGIDITTVYMPLVKTEMIAPTRLYDSFSAITPADAADLICSGIVHRPKYVSTWFGSFGQLNANLAPRVFDVALYLAYRLFPDSAAARGAAPHHDEQPGSFGKAFAHLLPGVHW